MIPIRNQPIIFPEIHPVMSYDLCGTNSSGADCVPLITGDTLYYQWKRNIEETPFNCPLIDYATPSEMIDTDDNTLGTNWSAGGGLFSHTGASGGLSFPTITPIDSLKRYRILFTVEGMGSGASLIPYCGTSIDPSNAGATVTADGTYSLIFQRNVGTADVVQFIGVGDLDIVIDSISMLELIESNECWEFKNWNYQDNGLTHIVGEVDPIELLINLTVGNHYRVNIESMFSQGIALLVNGTSVISAVIPNVKEYFFVATDAIFKVVPSADFNGSVSSINLHNVESLVDEQVQVIGDLIDSGTFDLVPFITYDREWATLIYATTDPVTNYEDGIPVGCPFKLQVFDNDSLTANQVSSCFQIVPEDECLNLVEATCDCEGYDFSFLTGFKLSMRTGLLFTNASYKFSENTNTQSNGVLQRTFAERKKFWTVNTNSKYALDEPLHDALSLMLHCDNLQVDGVDYFCDDKDYAIKWDVNGTLKVAESSFELSLKDSVIYNRNAGCDPQVYNLRVLFAWDEVATYKEIEKLVTADGDSITFKLNSFLVNGLPQISSPKYLNIVVGSPDNNFTDPINGNVTASTSSPLFLTNIVDFVNSFTNTRIIEFLDNMSVVNYQDGITFEVEILTKSVNFGSDDYAFKWIYDNAGLRVYFFSGGSWVPTGTPLEYVQ